MHLKSSQASTRRPRGAAPLVLIALIAFFTLVDLFAAQAILPPLAKVYGVTPAAMGLAVNACTLGMAVAGLLVAVFDRKLDRKRAVLTSLVLLTLPTALLAVAPDLTTFALLRVVQGLCMATAFGLTLTYLAEHAEGPEVAGAFAAYITGNVASNLFGRLVSAVVADWLGTAGAFYVFAAVNLLGALLVLLAFERSPAMISGSGVAVSPLRAVLCHLRNRRLLAAFGVGFCILFAFIGVFTYVNFVLVRPPLALGMMSVGLVYMVFAPSMVLTPLAGRVVRRFGVRPSIWTALAVAAAGLPSLLFPVLPIVLGGMVLIAAGTFFAQAVSTGFVGRAAPGDKGAASGLYLAAYFVGGLVGSAVLGQVFDRYGWTACVLAVGGVLIVAALLCAFMTVPEISETKRV